MHRNKAQGSRDYSLIQVGLTMFLPLSQEETQYVGQEKEVDLQKDEVVLSNCIIFFCEDITCCVSYLLVHNELPCLLEA